MFAGTLLQVLQTLFSFLLVFFHFFAAAPDGKSFSICWLKKRKGFLWLNKMLAALFFLSSCRRSLPSLKIKALYIKLS